MRKFWSRSLADSSAFTLIEILMVLALVGILSTASITLIGTVSDDASYDKTVGRMQLIRTALVGDLDTNKQGLREYYGYLGDVGSLPQAYQGLQALLTQPSVVSAWAMNSTARIGVGWRGPYLKGTTGVNWLVDGWGRAFIYNATATPPNIISYGSDGAVSGTGSARDIQIDLGPEYTTSAIHGVINDNGRPFTDVATIQLYQPDGNGGLQTRTTSVTAASNGYFTFTNVPFGQRSLKIFFPDTTSPVDTIGPSMISIDNSNYNIAHNFLDRSPGALPHSCDDDNALLSFDLAPNTSLLQFEPQDDNPNNDIQGIDQPRFYFEIIVKKSMVIDDIYLQFSDSNVQFEGLRIGNDTRYCRYHPLPDGSLTDYFNCYDYNIDFLSYFGIDPEVVDSCDTARFFFGTSCSTTNPTTSNMAISDVGYNTLPSRFPEISLNRSWTIPASDNSTAYTPRAGKRLGVYVQVRGNAANIDAVDYIDLRLACKMVRINR